MQVSISTNQLFLAFQVKADSNSAAMDGLQNAKAAIKRATDELVRVAKDSIREEETPVMIKTDIFKEVDIYKFTRYNILQYFVCIQRIDAEARVLKLEREQNDAKAVVKQLKQLPLRSVGDIKRVN